MKTLLAGLLLLAACEVQVDSSGEVFTLTSPDPGCDHPYVSTIEVFKNGFCEVALYGGYEFYTECAYRKGEPHLPDHVALTGGYQIGNSLFTGAHVYPNQYWDASVDWSDLNGSGSCSQLYLVKH
jgi:hypothetical protein